MALAGPIMSQAQKTSSRVYPVVVHFTSEGSGVPSAKPVTDFIRAFEKKNKTTKIKADTIGPRGREGEYTLAFTLANLTKKQRAAFISGLKNVRKNASDPGQIHVEENVKFEPPHDRQPSQQKLKID